MTKELIFNNFVEISSQPYESFDLSDLIIFQLQKFLWVFA
jgi:hypothetical protein